MNFSRCIAGLLVGLFLNYAHASDIMFQASTIDALMQGVYDGTMTFGELKKHGDFGLGTLNGLDGEMIGLNGHFYQGLANGQVRPIGGEMKTPFASVTFFHPTYHWKIGKVNSLAELQKIIDAKLPSGNLFYAIRVMGEFSTVKLRSVPRQHPPYRLLVDVVKTQSEFSLRSLTGTLVGFYCPPYVTGINVPGYHFHFLSEDAEKGGHVLDCSLMKGTIEMDPLPAFFMALPQDKAFLGTDLSHHKAEALKGVEQNSH